MGCGRGSCRDGLQPAQRSGRAAGVKDSEVIEKIFRLPASENPADYTGLPPPDPIPCHVRFVSRRFILPIRRLGRINGRRIYGG